MWVRRLDDIGGRELDHAVIARRLVETWDVAPWWAQNLTVTYEQVIGRRVVGQSCEGDFSASASRTVPGDPDAVSAAWDDFMDEPRREELGLGAPRLSRTEKWRYWRAELEDGTRVSVNITAKDTAGGDTRSTLAIEHKNIEDEAGRDAWKGAWKRTLAAFTSTYEGNR